ncbi:MAG TPA: type II secretion system protein [Holophagaceae bacterium]|nr:type II secretion system protein [Holophagaceae bacterium]
MKKQSGFTLIELLLVLAIIGIISAIAIPALLGQRARARDKSAVENATSILSDMISDSDKAKEAGAPLNNGADLFAVMTTTVAPLVQPLSPQVLDAKNPWAGTAGAPPTAYAQAVQDLGASDSNTVRGMSSPATLGQVQMGFIAPDPATGLAGVAASSVYIQNPFQDPVAGQQFIFYKIGNLE